MEDEVIEKISDTGFKVTKQVMDAVNVSDLKSEYELVLEEIEVIKDDNNKNLAPYLEKKRLIELNISRAESVGVAVDIKIVPDVEADSISDVKEIIK